MKNRLPFPAYAAILGFCALAAAACGSSDDTQGQDANSTSPMPDAAAEATSPTAEAGPEAAPTSVDAAPDSTSAVPDAGRESGPAPSADAAPTADAAPKPDATAEAGGGMPEAGTPTPDSGLGGLDLDACALPDGGLPDASLGDTGATTASCLSCIDTNCHAQEAACNGDCLCASQVISAFECIAGGQSAVTCLATATNPQFQLLALCVTLSCGQPTQCGL